MDNFFDKIKDGASKAKDGAGHVAKVFAKHTSKAINLTKLSYSISEANSKINEIYAQIGKDTYKKYLEGADADTEFVDMFKQIDSLMQDIDALNEKKATLKNSHICSNCGAGNAQDADYCTKCGAHLEKDEDDIDEEIEVDEIEITPQQS